MVPSDDSSTDDTRSDDARPDAGEGAARRRQVVFLVAFAVLLVGGFTVLSLNPVDRTVVRPFTAGVAAVSGVALDLIGQDVTRSGTVIRSKRFAVNIENGCNGIETLLIFGSAVLAFPVPWRRRLLGLAVGFVAIQAINLVRIVALFLTGAYLPDLFDASHTVVWQSLVVLFGIVLFLLWARRATAPEATPEPAG